MSMRFNAPPGWAVPSDDWTPPEGWQPEPWWPPAPVGWPFWTSDAAPPSTPASLGDPTLDHRSTTKSPSRRVKRWLITAGTAAILAVTATIVAAAAIAARNQITIADAQRECRTAFDKEMSARQERISADSTKAGVIVTVTDIELQETRKTEDEIEVNGTVRYEMASGLIPTIHGTVNLTCRAQKKNGQITTTVTNRD